MYKSIIDQISYFVDAFRSNQQRINFTQLVQFLVADPIFASLDKDFHKEIVRSTRNLQASDSLNELRLRLLYQIDFGEEAFDDAFVEALIGTYLSSNTANVLLNKIAKFGQYPFFKIEFMVYLLQSSDPEYFKKYLMNAILPLFPKKYDLEKLFLRLSQENPHNFAFIYIKKKRKLGRKFSRYNKEALKIQVNCWQKLSFMERLKCLWQF